MKFGHDLHRVVNVSDAEWAPYFMQYKLLKKCIKQIKASEAPADAGGPPAAPASPLTGRPRANTDERLGRETSPPPSPGGPQKVAIARSAPEVAFFRALRF